jgi:hypothetical protein
MTLCPTTTATVPSQTIDAKAPTHIGPPPRQAHDPHGRVRHEHEGGDGEARNDARTRTSQTGRRG